MVPRIGATVPTVVAVAMIVRISVAIVTPIRATVSGRIAATIVPNTNKRMMTAASSPISSAWFFGAVSCWTKSTAWPPNATWSPDARARAVAASRRSTVVAERSASSTP
jgi:hypothetical protein